MKNQQTAIPRDPLKIPRPLSNPAAALIRLQAQFDYQKTFHAKNEELQTEVRAIA